MVEVSLDNLSKDELKEALQNIIRDVSKSRPELIPLIISMVASNKEWIEWWNITTSLQYIRDMKKLGIIKFDGKSRYKLINKDIITEVLSSLGLIKWKPSENGPSFPVDESMFAGVVGYDIVKKKIIMSLRARKPVHVLLIGPPGIGKSIFLDSIRDFLKKKNACVEHVEAVKGLTTSVGIVDTLLSMPRDIPCVLLVDEIDKLSQEDLGVLYRLAESGEIIVKKHKKNIYEQRKVWIIAACNDDSKLSDPLKDRFTKIRFKNLTPDQYRKFVPQILITRESISPELAQYIADKLSRYTVDVREAIRFARLSYTKEDVDFLVESTFVKKI